MKNQNILRRLGELVTGRGFYIVMALAVVAVGASGYYLFEAVTDPLQSVQQAAEQFTAPETPVRTPTETPTQSRPVTKPETITLPDEEPAAVIPEPAPVQAAAPEVAVEPEVPTVFTWPVKGTVLREFSLETLSPDPTMGDWRTHDGLDVGAKLGTRVLCMTEGDIAEIWEDPLLGTCVRVEHGGGLESLYANLSPQPTVKVGDHMEIGAILGAVGNTASAESGMEPHLHLEVFREGESIDPLELLPDM